MTVVRAWLRVAWACLVWFGLAVAVSFFYNAARLAWFLAGGKREAFNDALERRQREVERERRR